MGGRAPVGPIGDVFLRLVQDGQVRGYGLGPGGDGLLRFILHDGYAGSPSGSPVTWSPVRDEEGSLATWRARMLSDGHTAHGHGTDHPYAPGLRCRGVGFTYVKAAIASTSVLPATGGGIPVPELPPLVRSPKSTQQLEQGFVYLLAPGSTAGPDDAAGYVFTRKVAGARTAVEYWFVLDPAIRLDAGSSGFETHRYAGGATVDSLNDAVTYMNGKHWDNAKSVFSVVAVNSVANPDPAQIDL